MTSQTKKKQVASARKRVSNRERLMTKKESSDLLLESASQALAMIKGSKLVGGRISVRQAATEFRQGRVASPQ